MDVVDEFVNKLSSEILNPIIGLLFALGLLYFFWGVVKYINNADNPEERKTGSQHMIWGVIGMFLMVAVWGVIAVIQNSLGI